MGSEMPTGRGCFDQRPEGDAWDTHLGQRDRKDACCCADGELGKGTRAACDPGIDFVQPFGQWSIGVVEGFLYEVLNLVVEGQLRNLNDSAERRRAANDPDGWFEALPAGSAR